MLNHITIMGRLTRDPELRYTPAQTPVTTFTLAVDRDYTNRDTNERQTDFIDCVAWRSAEFVSKYFQKGSMAVVSGRLQIRDWTDRDGGKRRSASVAGKSGFVRFVRPLRESRRRNRFRRRIGQFVDVAELAFEGAGAGSDPVDVVDDRFQTFARGVHLAAELAEFALDRAEDLPDLVGTLLDGQRLEPHLQ